MDFEPNGIMEMQQEATCENGFEETMDIEDSLDCELIPEASHTSLHLSSSTDGRTQFLY
jgi:hypothetical protein